MSVNFQLDMGDRELDTMIMDQRLAAHFIQEFGLEEEEIPVAVQRTEDQRPAPVTGDPDTEHQGRPNVRPPVPWLGVSQQTLR
jgi:hypothetical protein